MPGIFHYLTTSRSTEIKEFESSCPTCAQYFRKKAKAAAVNGYGKKTFGTTDEEELYYIFIKDEMYNKGRFRDTEAWAKSQIEQEEKYAAEKQAKSLAKVVEKPTVEAIEAAKGAAEATVPAEASSLQPTVSQAVQVYDMSSYTKRAKAAIEAEAASNNAVREKLEQMRQNVSLRAQERAMAANKSYIQEKKAALGDNTTINSTVPVTQEQTADTVENDNVIEQTEPMSIKEAYMGLELLTDVDSRDLALAYACLETGDPSIAEQLIHDHDAKAQAEAQYLAELDATKQLSKELAKEAGQEFAEGTVEDIMNGDLDAKQFSKNFDFFMTNLGDSIGAYVGAALSGVPSPNDCSTQSMTNSGLGVAGMLNFINRSANTINGLATFGTNLADAMADIYSHGPELLIAMAETTAQTAAQTTLMALRNASRTNCTIAMGMNIAEGTVAVGGAAIKAGISIAGTAKDLKGAADNLVRVVKKKDFMGDLKRRVKLHPAVRSMNDFIDGDKLDLATYSRLTRNGDKFARVMLGVDSQNRFTSAKKHMVSIPRSRQKFVRNNYSTTAECNKWNMYSRQSYSLANVI